MPTIVAYSAKDAVVDPAETLLAYERLGSPHKQLMEILDSGDRANHVLAGDIMSPGTTDEIARSIVDLLRQALPES